MTISARPAQRWNWPKGNNMLSPIKAYSDGHQFLAVYDPAAGKRKRYTLYRKVSDGVLNVIGRELTLAQCYRIMVYNADQMR